MRGLLTVLGFATCAATALAADESLTKLMQLKVGESADAISYMPAAEESLPDGPTSITFGPDGRVLLLDARQSRIVTADAGKIRVVADLSAISYPMRIETVNGVVTVVTSGNEFFRLTAGSGSTFQVAKLEVSAAESKSLNSLINPHGDVANISDDGAKAEIVLLRKLPFNGLGADTITLVSADRIVAANVEAYDEKSGSYAVFVERHHDRADGAIDAYQAVEFYQTDGAFKAQGNKVSRRTAVAVLPADRYGVYDSARVAVRFEGVMPLIAALNPDDDGGLALFRVKPRSGTLSLTAAETVTSRVQTAPERSAACSLARRLRPAGLKDDSNPRLVSAIEALATGHAFAEAPWTVQSRDNLVNACAVPCGPSGSTPGNCRASNPAGRVPGGWRQPLYPHAITTEPNVTGIPYAWAGYDSIDDFKTKLGARMAWGRYLAGDACTTCPGQSCNGISAGIDCSGLVGRMFRLGNSKPSTSTLATRGIQVRLDQAQAGDWLLRAGHHVATIRSVDKAARKVSVVESSLGCRGEGTGKHEGVCERDWTWATAELYTAYRSVNLRNLPLATMCPQ